MSRTPKINPADVFVDKNSAAYKEIDARNKKLQLDLALGKRTTKSSGVSLRNPDGTLKSVEEFFANEISAGAGSWELMTPREESQGTYQTMTAPTTNPSRPRATKIGYNKAQEKLVVRFRGKKGAEDSGPWWEYNGIPVDFWNDLKSSDSTGKYLAASGLDRHDDMGPFDPSEMSEETRVLFNS